MRMRLYRKIDVVTVALSHIACLAMSNPFFRSSAFITGSNSTLALRPTNRGSTIPGMSDASFISKNITGTLDPLTSVLEGARC